MSVPEKLNSLHFSWSKWRSGSPADFLVACREDALIGIRHRLRQHTIGYCDAEHLVCRPKRDHKAVMFYKDGERFWFHLTNKEFKRIYNV